TAGTPLVAPIAPGRVDRVVMRSCERLEPGSWHAIPFERGTLAFDGEREIEVARGDRYEIALDWRGPLTVDVGRTLRYASSRQLLRDAGAWHD
ncbi:ATP-NAD kinase, partial [Burkholderia cenocepacia]|nr:ATP-NAD kinase [Burkholderia cenocepacia]